MGKIIKTMAVTKEQLKVVFEIGAASEGTNLAEVTFSQKASDLYVYEKFEETDQSFRSKTTLISPFGVRTTDIEMSIENWPDRWPW